MEIIGGVLSALLIALVISALFYYAFNATGPWGSFWTFFLVLLLIIWAASLWVHPIGPVFWGIAWIPLLVVGLVFALLLAAIPTESSREDKRAGSGKDNALIEENPQVDPAEAERRRNINRTAATVTGTFWVFMLILLLVIMIGYVA